MKPNPCYCGHDCARCVTYHATVRNDDELRKKSQIFYREMFGWNLPLEKFRCLGGRSEERFCLSHGCPFRKCCRDREINSCADCADYPCPMIADYRKKYVNKYNQIGEEP